MKKRWLALIPLLLLLAGCGIVDDPARVADSLFVKASIEQRLAAAADRIRPIAGVDGVTSTIDMDADYRYRSLLEITAPDLPEASAVEIVTVLADELDDEVFDEHPVGAMIGERVTMSGFGVPLDELVADVEYWSAFTEAVGGPVLLQVGMEGEVRYRSVSATGLTGPVDWEALAAIPDASTARTTIGLPGLEMTGAVPGPEVAGLLRELDGILPALDYSDPDYAGYTLIIDGDLAQLSIASRTLTVPAAESPDWPAVTAAVSAALSSGLDVDVLSYYPADVGAGGIVHLGPCGTDGSPNEFDEDLFDALGAAGLDVPEGSTAGWCNAVPVQ